MKRPIKHSAQNPGIVPYLYQAHMDRITRLKQLGAVSGGLTGLAALLYGGQRVRGMLAADSVPKTSSSPWEQPLNWLQRRTRLHEQTGQGILGGMGLLAGGGALAIGAPAAYNWAGGAFRSPVASNGHTVAENTGYRAADALYSAQMKKRHELLSQKTSAATDPYRAVENRRIAKLSAAAFGFRMG